MIIFLGVLLGNISCNFLLPLTDATQIFVISSSFAALASVVMIICVDESVNVPDNVSTCDNLKSMISPVHFMEMLRTCFKKRSFKERRILLSLMTMLVLTVFTYSGTAAISYLFERERFGWTLQDHNLYDSTNIIFSISGCMIGIFILKKHFHFSEMTLIVLSVTSGVVDASLKAFAVYGWQMYAISAGAMFRILASPMYRTLITTIVPHNEIGKVFSITTAFEAISGFPSVPLYTIVYAKTLTFFPGAYFLITAGIYATNLILSIFVMFMKRVRDNLVNPYVAIES
jgi:PCFT/HCP family folate transporter-like MFS transporter 1/3